MKRNKNLTLSERIIIEKGIMDGLSKRDIATLIKKDESTIAKEIKLHRKMTYLCQLMCECSNYKHCKFNRNCKPNCPNFVLFKCKRRDKSPGACNGYLSYKYCRFTKYRYSSEIAQNEYEKLLVSSRIGINLTEDELKRISDIVCPLLLKRQSPYMIINNHPELNISERTLYSYIEAGLFKSRGVDVFTLRRYLSRKPTKKRSIVLKKRIDRKFLVGRKYDDYLLYMDENQNTKVVQMDTIYNDIVSGPFIQTIKFLEFGLLIGIYHSEKTAEAMVEGVQILEKALGLDIF